MTAVRLRSTLTNEELAGYNPTPHDHTQWDDHVLRVDATIKFGTEVLGTAGLGADLSCGSGAILRGLPVARRIFGDFAPGYEYTGLIEDTIEQVPDVDLFVCTETLEHLDDPAAVLERIRAKSKALLLSTPIENWDDTNAEHVWAWSRVDVLGLLTASGWDVVEVMELDFRACGPYFYDFLIVACR